MTRLLFMEEINRMPENEKPELVGSGSPDTIASVVTAIVSECRISNKTDSTMTQRFIKFIPCEAFFSLLRNHPNAFSLLSLIAARARRTPSEIEKLAAGECYIGDHESCGLTRQQYRTALSVLIKGKLVEIISNCRTCKKSTTISTTYRTKVRLLSSDIWDINLEETNHHINHQSTTNQPPISSTQYIVKNEKKNTQSFRNGGADAATIPETKSIHFDLQTGKWENITDDDRLEWKELYPNIDVQHEMKLAAEWCRSNPTKAKLKKQWRKFLSGWLKRADDSAFNKAAYRGSKNAITPDVLELNREYAKKWEGKTSIGGGYTVDALGSCLEIRPCSGRGHVTQVPYNENGFRSQVDNALRAARFEVVA
jgi:hypothetical protein